MFSRLYLKRRRISWPPGEERGRKEERGKEARGERVQVHDQPLELAATRLPFHTPRAQRQKEDAVFDCGLEEESLQRPRGGANSQCQGELLPAPRPPVCLLLPEKTCAQRLKFTAGALGCAEALAEDFWGGREELPSFLPQNIVTGSCIKQAGFKFKVPARIPLPGPVRRDLTTSQKHLSISRTQPATCSSKA